MVFRGHGFETVRAALGQGKAVAVLIPGFALYQHLQVVQNTIAATIACERHDESPLET